MVVLPVPEPPQSIMLGTRSCSMRPRRTPEGPTSSWPQTSSKVFGRMRSASGAAFCNALEAFGRFAEGSASGAVADDFTGVVADFAPSSLFDMNGRLASKELELCGTVGEVSFFEVVCKGFLAEGDWKKLETGRLPWEEDDSPPWLECWPGGSWIKSLHPESI
jgi:hypothetical protein